MKFGVPWSVKGIRPEARETTREAARRSGVSLGEWLNSVILQQAEDEDMRVRFRVDGVLYEAARVPKRMAQAVISRIKIMSSLDIAEKRVPQDGRVSVTVEDRRVDLRVTTLPTQRGGPAMPLIFSGSAWIFFWISRPKPSE